jgi:hypothetical protein
MEIARYRFHVDRAKMYAARGQSSKSKSHYLRASTLLARFGQIPAKRKRPSNYFLDDSATEGRIKTVTKIRRVDGLDVHEEVEVDDDAPVKNTEEDEEDEEDDDESDADDGDVSFDDVVLRARYVRAMLWPNGDELPEPIADLMIGNGAAQSFGAFEATWFLKNFIEVLPTLGCMEEYSGMGSTLPNQTAIVRKMARFDETKQFLKDIEELTGFIHWKARKESINMQRAMLAQQKIEERYGSGVAKTMRKVTRQRERHQDEIERASANEYMDFLMLFADSFIKAVSSAHMKKGSNRKALRDLQLVVVALLKRVGSGNNDMRELLSPQLVAALPGLQASGANVPKVVYEHFMQLLAKHAESSLTAEEKHDHFTHWVRTLTGNPESAADHEGNMEQRLGRFLDLSPDRAGLVGGTLPELVETTIPGNRLAADIGWVRANEIRWLKEANFSEERIAEIRRAKREVVQLYITLAYSTDGSARYADFSMQHLVALQLSDEEKINLAEFAENHKGVLLEQRILESDTWKLKPKVRGELREAMLAELDLEYVSASKDHSWPFATRLDQCVDRICGSWSAIINELRHGPQKRERLRITDGKEAKLLAENANHHSANLEHQNRMKMATQDTTLKELAEIAMRKKRTERERASMLARLDGSVDGELEAAARALNEDAEELEYEYMKKKKDYNNMRHRQDREDESRRLRTDRLSRINLAREDAEKKRIEEERLIEYRKERENQMQMKKERKIQRKKANRIESDDEDD